MQEFFAIQNRISQSTNLTFIRFLYEKVSWNSRLIGIIGARGTGKSTLVLQYYKKAFNNPEDCLYISADNPLVLKKGIYSLVGEFFQSYGDTVIIDEVHKQENWSTEIKSLYDSFPTKRIILLGSSTLNILQQKGDLSRRLKLYTLPVLSFREFLSFRFQKILPIFTFDEVLENHVKLTTEVTLQVPNILKEFREYLQIGSFPFFIENTPIEYLGLLENVLDKVIYEDIQTIRSINNLSALKLKKLIGFLAMSSIPSFNIETLKNEIEVSKDTLYEYFDLLDRANIIQIVRTSSKSVRGLKNSKVFFQSPNYYYSIAETFWKHAENLENIRESFFVSQLSQFYPISVSDIVDFVVPIKNAEVQIEIGGKSKKKKQVENIGNGYIFKDGIEVGAGNVIPLYMAGMLY